MSHVFLSYSRRDLDSAQKIVDALGRHDLDIWIDWNSIPKGEDWEQEIYRGIEAADAFLFLISPDSIISEMCNREIAHAVQNGKRILPIVLRDADMRNFLQGALEAEISKRNWIHCRQGQDDFDTAIQHIQTTIRTNYAWLRFHAILQTKALAWERAKKDRSRLLRGRELKDAEQQIAKTEGRTEPFLTDLQREYITKSRKSFRQGQSLPYKVILLLAAAIFLGGKFFFLVIPISRACPQVENVSFDFEGSELPVDTSQRILEAINNSPSKTRLRNCDAGLEEKIQVTAGYQPETEQVELSVRLPKTPAYRLDFLQEIREFGPQLFSEQEAIALLNAFSAYSVGEYQTVIDLLEGYDTLSALTLTAQARLFTDDLPASQETYEIALEKPQPNEDYTGKLYMGAALAHWRPESYYELSFEGNKDGCKKAGAYYAKTQEWIASNKLAQNIRAAYAWFCINKLDEKDPDYAGYIGWKDQPLHYVTDLNAKDAELTNAIASFISAARIGPDDITTRSDYINDLISAQTLMLGRADLSEYHWGVEENCGDARAKRDEFRSGIISSVEKRRLQKLLQTQPLFCR
jgi:hypothetical protein